VDREEHIQDVAKRGHIRIEGDLDDFGVPTPASANLFVGRVLDMPAHVSRFNFGDASHIEIHGFEAPETASSECGLFESAHMVLDARSVVCDPESMLSCF
jgi:hypothetical protein